MNTCFLRVFEAERLSANSGAKLSNLFISHLGKNMYTSTNSSIIPLFKGDKLITTRLAKNMRL